MELHEIPPHILQCASDIETYFRERNITGWELGGICDRERIFKLECVIRELKGLSEWETVSWNPGEDDQCPFCGSEDIRGDIHTEYDADGDVSCVKDVEYCGQCEAMLYIE